jgi:hypothetical protein
MNLDDFDYGSSDISRGISSHEDEEIEEDSEEAEQFQDRRGKWRCSPGNLAQ